MSNAPASLTTLLEGDRAWLADLKGGINIFWATASSWRKNYSD
jgi:hypothetical protein